MLCASELFDFPESLPFGAYFTENSPPWDWVPAIKVALADFSFPELRSDIPSGLSIEGAVYIHPSVKLPAFGSIQGPAYIAAGCELRPGVFILGNVIVGPDSVLGNSCEFKNCLLLQGVQVPHFSYVGDSVLGNGAHLGAGVICSNLRLDQAEIQIKLDDGTLVPTGLRKLGAILGDHAEVGCNAVLNPGSTLGKRALVMPSVAFSGNLAAGTIAYQKAPIQRVRRPDS